MPASLAHWFINAAIALPHIRHAQTVMIQKVTVMITPSTVEFLLRHQAAVCFDEQAHLFAVSRHRVILLYILCIDPGCSFYYEQVFYWRMITLNDVKRGEKRSTRIMTFWRERWGEKTMEMGVGVDGCTWPVSPHGLTNWVASLLIHYLSPIGHSWQLWIW